MGILKLFLKRPRPPISHTSAKMRLLIRTKAGVVLVPGTDPLSLRRRSCGVYNNRRRYRFFRLCRTYILSFVPECISRDSLNRSVSLLSVLRSMLPPVMEYFVIGSPEVLFSVSALDPSNSQPAEPVMLVVPFQYATLSEVPDPPTDPALIQSVPVTVLDSICPDDPIIARIVIRACCPDICR